jgi:gliding motility-associated-like protein
MNKHLLIFCATLFCSSLAISQTETAEKYRAFQGDSLKGYDLKAAFADMTRFDARVHLDQEEKNVFMKIRQQAYVQKKYNLGGPVFDENAWKAADLAEQKAGPHHGPKKFVLAPGSANIPFKKAATAPATQGMAGCDNLDWEDANVSNWSGTMGYSTTTALIYYGIAPLSSAPLSQSKYVGAMAGGGNYFAAMNAGETTCAGVTQVSAGNDPRCGVPMVGVGGFSIRMGGENVNLGNGFGTSCNRGDNVSPWESAGELIQQSIAVTASNCLITYNYNVVLADGGHTAGYQPFFQAGVQDNTGTDINCALYYQECTIGVPPPGYSTAPGKDPIDAAASVFYSNWQSNTVDLTAQIGTTVTLYFFCGGCVPGGHFGYAYVDGHCGPKALATVGATVCAGNNTTVKAPPLPVGTTYSWSGPGIVGSTTGSSVTVNAGGNYTVTWTLPAPNNACPIAVTANVVFYPSPVITPTTTNPLCNGSATGIADGPASGANGPYTYNWVPAPPGGQGTQTATGLACGTSYTLTATSNDGCPVSKVYSITCPSALATAPTQTNINCSGLCTGVAKPVISGGKPGYTYVWSGPGAGFTGTGQGTATASALCAGTYSVTVTDANNCPVTVPPFTITDNPLLTVTSTATTTTGCGVSTGMDSVTTGGGVPGYTYTWVGPGAVGFTGSGQGTPKVTNLAAGTYTCTVKDSKGCTQSTVTTINTANGPVLTALPTNIPALVCNAACIGKAGVSVTGGTAPFVYAWTNTASTVDSAFNLCAGTYVCTVTDKNSCKSTQSFTITQPTVISSAPTSTSATCGGANGSASVNASGGTPGPGYTYSWSPAPAAGQTTGTAINLSSGVYTVVVTDNSGCSKTFTVPVSNSGGPVAAASTIANPNCFASCIGQIANHAAGGAAPLTYSWSPAPGAGQNTATASSLCAGVYTCTVTDKNGCVVHQVDTIQTPAAVIVVSSSQTNLSCNGGACNGVAKVVVSGGNPGYSFAWTGSPSIKDSASGLCTGTYTCTITDTKGCTNPAPAVFTITQPSALSSTPTVSNVTCNGQNNGSISLSTTGGTVGSGYTYVWSPAGPTGSNPTNLGPGKDTCTITDALGCSTQVFATITQPPLLTASGVKSDATCQKANGSVTVTPVGGSGLTDTYAWSPSVGNTATVSNLNPNIYTCTVTDSLGCVATVIDTVINSTLLPVSAIINNVVSDTVCTGTAGGILSVSNPLAGTNYVWTPGPVSTDSIAVNSAATTTYTLTATNVCGVATSSVTIHVLSAPSNPTVSGGGIKCPGSLDTLFANVVPADPSTTYLWSPQPGGTLPYIVVNSAGTWTVSVTNKCSVAPVSGTASVSLHNIWAHFRPNILVGYAPQPVTFSDSSSATAVTWTWNFGDGTTGTGPNPTHTYANAGNYIVTETVTDINGCAAIYTLPEDIKELPSWIDVPNVFTPNGDGSNDDWRVRSQGITSFDCKIYDRWGVFMSELLTVGAGWDGRTSGGLMAVPGTYYYMLTAKGDDGKSYDFKGFMMLIRE